MFIVILCLVGVFFLKFVQAIHILTSDSFDRIVESTKCVKFVSLINEKRAQAGRNVVFDFLREQHVLYLMCVS